MKSENYKSDIKLGEEYRDTSSGLMGKAIAVVFFEHACERVTLRYLHDGELKEASFDAPELESAKSGEVARTTKPGGPARTDGRRGVISR